MNYELYREYYTTCASIYLAASLLVFITSWGGLIYLCHRAVGMDPKSENGERSIAGMAWIMMIGVISFAPLTHSTCQLVTAKLRAVEKAESLK